MNKFEEWVCDSNKALNIALGFHPEYSYPVFGEEEKIYGYKDLKIKLYYTAGSLYPYLGINFSKQIPPKLGEAQDVFKSLTQKLPKALTYNYDEFAARVGKDEKEFVPMGEKIHEYKTKDDETIEYYRCDFETKKFRQYHQRLQTFLLWFIEGSSFIEDDDARWQIILIFKKSRMETAHSIVGYMTYYPFYHYPDKLRMRISQFLILPPYQGKGYGHKLYQYTYQMFLSNPQVVDITVEDPNDGFQDMRDRSDVQMLLKNNVLAGVTPGQMKRTHITELRVKYRLCERQAIRCAEILLLKRTPKWDTKRVLQYRLFVKKRLYKKNKEVLDQMEFGDRLAALQHTYNAVEEDYNEVLDKIE